jgi:hypothetical protein
MMALPLMPLPLSCAVFITIIIINGCRILLSQSTYQSMRLRNRYDRYDYCRIINRYGQINSADGYFSAPPAPLLQEYHLFGVTVEVGNTPTPRD